jgi:hypothetical protein
MKLLSPSKTRLLLALSVFFSFAQIAFSQNTKTVLDNYFKAIGGKEKAMQVETFSSIAKGIFNKKEITLETIAKIPNKFHSVLKSDSKLISEKTFDGLKGYSTNKGNTIDFDFKTNKQHKKRRSIFPEFNYYKKGNYEGTATINGILTHVISIDDFLIFYDAKSGLKLKGIILEQSKDKPKKELYYSKYIEIEGILFPSRLEVSVNNKKIAFQSVTISLNRDVTNNDF